MNARFDYQIGGAYQPNASVSVVSRDRLEDPVPGRYNICYLNAFQTQPDDAHFWTQEHPTLLARRGGRLVTDPEWPGEYLLDTSTAAKREALAGIEGPWVTGCAARGFQAVEPDNLDSWIQSKRVLERSDNLAFATVLTQRAHAAGLAVAQKNTSQLGREGARRVGFDFAVTEECQVYDECDEYTAVYGRQVLEIEYTDNPRAAFTRACAARGESISVILRDRDVVPRGRAGYHYDSC